MGFQTQVNSQPGVGQEGDFADANIRTTVQSGPGGFIAAPIPRGPIIGHFAWGDQAAAVVLPAVGEGMLAFSKYQGEPAEIGFVHREYNTIIVDYLSGNTNYVQPGLIVSLFNNGGFWAKFAAGAVVGQKVFAKYVDGSCVSAAAGPSTQVASVTASLANTGVLPVTAVGSGTLHPGDVGTDAAGNSYAILSQLTSTGGIGNTGTYQTSLTGVTSGGGTVTTADRVETDYYVDLPANNGELAKISTWG